MFPPARTTASRLARSGLYRRAFRLCAVGCVGAGLAWRMRERQALTADLRLQVFGAPRSANDPIAMATGATALMFNVGYEWDFLPGR